MTAPIPAESQILCCKEIFLAGKYLDLALATLFFTLFGIERE